MTNITDQNNFPTDTEIDVNKIPQIPNMNEAIKTGSTQNRNNNFRLVFILVFFLAIGFVSGGILGKLNSKETTKIQTYKITKPVNIFPIDISVLQNPMFSEWSGRLKGRIRELKAGSFSISQVKEEFRPDGQIIVIDTINPNLTEIEVVSGITKFFTSSASASFGQTPIPITFNELKTNEIVEGSVRIKYDNSRNILNLTGVSFTLR